VEIHGDRRPGSRAVFRVPHLARPGSGSVYADPEVPARLFLANDSAAQYRLDVKGFLEKCGKTFKALQNESSSPFTVEAFPGYIVNDTFKKLPFP